MQSGNELPTVAPATVLAAALFEISSKGLGMTTVVDDNGGLMGVFTDGDLRRALDAKADLNSTPIGDLMSTSVKTVTSDMLAAEALRIMEENKISSLAVVDGDSRVTGVVHLLSLLRAGIA